MGNFMGENGKKLLIMAGFAAVLYVVFQYFFPLAAPFLLAFLIVYPSYPWVKKVQKKTGIRKELLLGGLLFLTVLLIVLGIWGIVSWGTVHAADIGDSASQMREQVGRTLHDGCIYLEKKFGLNAQETELGILRKAEQLAQNVETQLWPQAARQSVEYLQEFLGVAAFLGISFISCLLLCRDYEKILKQVANSSVLGAAWRYVEKIVHLIGGYLKAQLKIMTVISVVAVAGLLASRIQGAVLLGLLAGILDALPFVGTGIVFLPTALWQLLHGKWGVTVWIIVVYVACIGARELLEPRLLGKQLGIYPVMMLFAVYAGVKVFGITGIFLGPLYVVLLKEGYGVLCRNVNGEEL
ncbi:MAG: AI-2E family transporter [Lachnospiraceae bacterium]|nr:AI-2E family transporter [Lachnospiraceae bacterium]